MELDADSLSHLKVKDLQRELKKRGLDTSGLKAALLQRLKEHLQQTKSEDVEQETEKEKEKEQTQTNDAKDEAEKGDEEEQVDKKDEAVEKPGTESNGQAGDKPTGKRAADTEEDEDAPDAKKPKLDDGANANSPQPEDEDDKPTANAENVNSEKAVDDDTEKDHKTTLRIDNFVRPFTLNAVKALVQELGNFVEDGFWMDVIKTHCYVTYSSPDVAQKTSSALDGKVWPPENGRALRVKFVDHTAMEVSQYGEANLPSRPKSKNSNDTQATQRQKVTIDEFFQKTETKPVLYYLPLTDEQIKERKQRQSQQPEGQPRKRRHRGGRKRNRRARFRR